MSRYRVEFLKAAQKEFSKLPKEVQRRISTKIDALQINPYPTDSKKLKNGNGRFRVRVGNYRVIYRPDEGELIVLVIKVGHRRDVYQ